MNILVVGDFYPAGRLSGLATEDPSRLFGSFGQVIREADVAVLNLETPLCYGGTAISKTGPAMKAHPDSAQFLQRAGFKLATLANNHIFDYGSEGLAETIKVLSESGIGGVGAGNSLKKASEPVVTQVDGASLAILSFAENEWSTTNGKAPGANPLDPVSNSRAIKHAKEQADAVVVICHGGHEMYPLPSPRMKELFRFYVESGADAVVNHHAHVTSGYEVYRGAPIFYSLGNFLFDRPDSRSGPWTEGIAVELSFSPKGVEFEIHFFEQCTVDSIFSPCQGASRRRRVAELDHLNEIISDDEALGRSFCEFVERKTRQYRRYLEPSTIRLIEAAQSRGLLPSLLSRRQRLLLLNLIRCESHREVLIEMLERDVGNPR